MMGESAERGRMVDVGGGPRARDDASGADDVGGAGVAGTDRIGAGRGGLPANAALPEYRSAPPTEPAATPPGIPACAPTDTADLREVVRAAADAGTSLRLAGAGGWLDAGRPVRAARLVFLGGLSGIVEYVPGDLTMTARAGTPLADLQAAALAEGQFIPLDPWGGDQGTLGATLATATAGPLSGAFGLPRDVVLGMTAVTGTGELIRGGGRVVKNVAGFDLVRLMVGAWGTLGVLTEATVRLRAIPEGDETLAIPIGTVATGPDEALATWLARLRVLPVHPLAAELLDRILARTLGLDDVGAVLLVRVAGNEAAMAAQRAALATLGDPTPVPSGWWARLRTADADRVADARGAVLRLSAPPADLAACWHAARGLVARANGAAAASGAVASAIAHASVTRGVVRVCLPPLADEALRAVLGDSWPAWLTRRFERLPAGLWPIVAPSAVADPLSRGVRRAFDPRGILNPGILGAESDPPAAADGGGRPGAVGGITPVLTSPLS
ncbi:MAG: FAD-binding oxidoreductase [Gemmatimonadaceae bacterium]